MPRAGAWILAVAALLSACAGGGGAGRRGSGDAPGVPGLEDADRMVGRLVDGMAASPFVGRAGGTMLRVGIAEVRNRMDQDWAFVQQLPVMLRTSLIASGRFDCIDPRGPAGAKRGADFLVVAEVAEISEPRPGGVYRSVVLDLELIETASGAVRWSGQEVYRTRSTRAR